MEAAANKNRVRFIVRGMTYYVTRIYKKEKFQDNSMSILMEDLYLPRDLKSLLLSALEKFKNERFVTAHNHCVNMADRENHVTGSFRSGLLEIANDSSHLIFIRECALYIMAATEMEKLGFLEARNIVMDAIYQACVNSKQHESLVLWETQPKSEENTLNNHTDPYGKGACSNGAQNDNDRYSSDVEIIIEKAGFRELETVLGHTSESESD